MKRDPNGPIPGFEDEFYGTVGKEKRIHRTHFDAPGIRFKKTDFDTGNEWVLVGRKWKLLPKKVLEDADRRR